MGLKTAFLELEGWEVPIIQEKLKGADVVKLSTLPLQEETLPEDVEVLSVFIYSKLNRDTIDRLPKLKLIATRSTGYNHIDVEYAKSKGIQVCNVPNYGDQTVAEYTVALILCLLRKLKPTFERVSRGVFTREGLRGTDLQGKKVGVVGTGRIGSKVIKILSTFEVQLLACDPKERRELVEAFGVRYVSLEELLSSSDIVTVHVPYTKETHHLINRENIKLMKRGSYLVNTSRGPVIETEAVHMALENGILAGAALDTFEGEEVWMEEELFLTRSELSANLLRHALENFHLLHLENVILTPHNAYNTKEAIRRILATTIENINSFIREGKPIYPL